jgi:hypothetical protein
VQRLPDSRSEASRQNIARVRGNALGQRHDHPIGVLVIGSSRGGEAFIEADRTELTFGLIVREQA